MSEAYESLKKELQKGGFTVKTTLAARTDELKGEIFRLREQALIDGQLYDQYLGWMNYDYKDAMPEARSIIVVSKPQYPTLLHFQYEDKSYHIPVPPTYLYSEMWSLLEELLTGALSPFNYGIRKAALPGKLLAVRTGLGMYGRNNIFYVKGAGSFHRLFTYYSDMPPAQDDWQDVEVMPECGKCEACVRACPTKCIDRERFLIHADKCITRYNENEGDFPEWFHRSWHNSIVGCMRCQQACPQNREFLGGTDREIDFAAEETELILEGKPLESLPSTLRQKLEGLDMIEYYSVLGRNLEVLLGNKGSDSYTF